jgi:D-glycerate 3-kinase
MGNVKDPKIRLILDFIIPHLDRFHERQEDTEHISRNQGPLIIALSGCQGSGKSTLAAALVSELSTVYGFHAAEISLDDFYHTRATQEQLSRENPENYLLRRRGLPGTHDVELAEAFFSQFREEHREDPAATFFWPSFNKSLFKGKGDRIPVDRWKQSNAQHTVDILIFEGWCVGFQPLGPNGVLEKWSAAQGTNKRLASTRLKDLLLMDDALEEYCDGFMGPSKIDVLVHLDIPTLETVYMWREEQEHALRERTNGSGMTKNEVVEFGKVIISSTVKCERR